MSAISSVLLVAGAIVIGLGVRVASAPISDRIVRDVIEAVHHSSGDDPTPEAMRAHIRNDRRRWGLCLGALGAVMIGIALLA